MFIAAQPQSLADERVSAISDELMMGTMTPGQTSDLGALIGMTARSEGDSTVRSRRLANRAVMNQHQLNGVVPEFRSFERDDGREAIDPCDYARVTFGMQPLSDRLINEADLMSALATMPAQGLDTHTGVYLAGRLANDAAANMLAHAREDVGGVLQQWRTLHDNTMPFDQRGLEGARGDDETSAIMAPTDPRLVASTMGLSQTVAETLRQTNPGLERRQVEAAQGLISTMTAMGRLVTEQMQSARPPPVQQLVPPPLPQSNQYMSSF